MLFQEELGRLIDIFKNLVSVQANTKIKQRHLFPSKPADMLQKVFSYHMYCVW